MTGRTDFGFHFRQALRHCRQGRIITLNGAGAPGRKALEEVGAVIESGHGPRWSTSAGDCFFTSVDVMTGLMIRKTSLPFRLATGRFDQPDASEPIFHAWLEARCGPGDRIVVNVSNLLERPLYTVGRQDYLARNYCADVIQSIGAPEFRKRAAAALRSQDRPGRDGGLEDLDIIGFTKTLLRKTFSTAEKALLPPSAEPGP